MQAQAADAPSSTPPQGRSKEVNWRPLNIGADQFHSAGLDPVFTPPRTDGDRNSLAFLPVRLAPHCSIRIGCKYSGERTHTLVVDEKRAAEAALAALATTAHSIETLSGACDSLKDRAGTERDKDAVARIEALRAEVENWLTIVGAPLSAEARAQIDAALPRFFYFDEYSTLPGRCELRPLLEKKQGATDDRENTVRALLRLSGVTGAEFLDNQFESRTAELEAAANEITHEVFNYWTQNQNLRVEFAIDTQTDSLTQNQQVRTPQGQQATVPVERHTLRHFLDIRLHDTRHLVTTNFERRSTGFQWFFSCVAAFSEFDERRDVIILLDEPGTGLHARAQSDLLRYVDERLAVGRQVLYSTHSPFMINPKHLERARLVEDNSTMRNPDIGTRITDEVLQANKETIYPLQAALGYDLAQLLFTGPHQLIVEGSSDLIYLSALSDHLIGLKRTGLDSRWTIVPVGGADKVPTFRRAA